MSNSNLTPPFSWPELEHPLPTSQRVLDGIVEFLKVTVAVALCTATAGAVVTSLFLCFFAELH